MKHWLIASLLALVAIFTPRVGSACGGGFGVDVEVEPTQTIIVVHGDGVERYIFEPVFCGAPQDFGLIVPIPTALTGQPTLAAKDLSSVLETYAAPTVETEKVCAPKGRTGGGVPFGGDGVGGSGGVDVISEGSVGIFDWQELDATSASAFTDYLDQNAFPYEPESTVAFDHYVQQSWRFVAFTVRAGDIGSASRVCGEFGPIEIAFTADTPVIPARIAVSHQHSQNAEFVWQVFAVSDTELDAPGVPPHPDTAVDSSERRFSGQITSAALTDHTRLGDVAADGDWLTELRLTFVGRDVTGDFTLEPTSDPGEFRRVIVDEEEVSCGGGCAIAPFGASNRALAVLVALVGLALASRRRKRSA